MTVESLKNLDLLGNATPLPDSVRDYYDNNISLGSGPCGTYLLTDFLGSAAGIPGNQYVSAANQLIDFNLEVGQPDMLVLKEVYDAMRELVTSSGAFTGGPPFASITINGSPLPGSPFATYDAALQALIARADEAVGDILVNLPYATTAAQEWTAWVKQFANESVFQAKASIDFATLPGNTDLPITVMTTNLATYGQDTQVGMSAQFLESIADTSTQPGQAMVGAMREGRNNQALDEVLVGHDNVIPTELRSPAPKAQLSDGNYTVSEARAKAIALRRAAP